MTVHKVTGIDGPGYADYLTCKDAAERSGDYYLGRSGRPSEGRGTWHGSACAELDLPRVVRRSDLMRVWAGRDPRNGEIVVRRGATGDHVAGVDVTFSAPKSVSVLWALSEQPTRRAVEAAHHEGVLAALRHIEATVELARRRDGDAIVHERVAGILAARFRHHTSRLTPDQYERGQAPDPQLHDHVVIANMALRLQPDSDGNRWAAIDSRQLYRVAAEAGAVYRAELALRLQRMGYSIVRDGRYFEVAGIGAALRERFSSRSAELATAVRTFREEHGRPPTPAERKALTLMTRIQKSVEHAPAFEQWRRRAGDSALPNPEYGPPAPVDRDAVVAEIVQELTDPNSPRYLTKDAAVVDDRTVRTAIAEAAQGRIGGDDIGWLIDHVLAAPQLRRVDDHHWTTLATVQLEREVMFAAHRRAERSVEAPQHVVTAAIQGARVPLSAEQTTAVRQLVGHQFGILTAPAGTGKGEVLRAVAEVRCETGYLVIALAAAGETAQRFGREVGAHQAMTVDGFLHRVQQGRLHVTAKTAILVDEAGLLEDWRWGALMRAAGDAAVSVAGDPHQLSPSKRTASTR